MTSPIPLAKARITGQDKEHPERFRNRLDPDLDELGPPPGYFDADQKKTWQMFRNEIPWLTAADRGLVEIASRLRTRIRCDQWEASVLTMNALRQCLVSMGATPVDRARIKTADEPPADAQERHFG